MDKIAEKITELWCGECEYKGKCEDAPYGGGLLGIDCMRKRDAAKAYDTAAKETLGEFANLNITEVENNV